MYRDLRGTVSFLSVLLWCSALSNDFPSRSLACLLSESSPSLYSSTSTYMYTCTVMADTRAGASLSLLV